MARMKAFQSAQRPIGIALSFLTVFVAAPPVVIATTTVIHDAAITAMILLCGLLLFPLVVVLRAPTPELGLARGLLTAGVMLILFPLAVVVVVLANAGSLAEGGADIAAVCKDFLVSYDLAAGSACLALGWLVNRSATNAAAPEATAETASASASA